MSQGNVEIVRRASAEAADHGLQAAYAFLDPEIEWVVARDHPNARVLVGREAVVSYQREWEETLPDMRVEIEQLLDAGENVVGIGSVRGTGAGSGAGVHVRLGFVYTVRDGLIVRVEEFLRPAEALEAAGLDR